MPQRTKDILPRNTRNTRKFKNLFNPFFRALKLWPQVAVGMPVTRHPPHRSVRAVAAGSDPANQMISFDLYLKNSRFSPLESTGANPNTINHPKYKAI